MDRTTALFLSFCSTLPALVAQDWRLRASNGPAPANFPRMAYDSARARSVLFGGWAGNSVFDQTWEWDGASWSLRATPVAPPERDDHAMAFDSSRGRTVLWGGEDLLFRFETSVWEWDGSQWHNPQPSVLPPGRLGLAMCYDAARGVVVMFGGTDWIQDFGDHWEWNGTTWTPRNLTRLPSARGHHAMAYDAARQRCVLFGGEDSSGLLGDTWEFDGATWVQKATDGAPSARTSPAFEYDATRARCVLFGGADDLLDLQDTWEYDGRTWFRVWTATVPPRNVASASSFDAGRGQMVVFGGYGGTGPLGDTYEYGLDDASYRTYGEGCLGSNGLAPRLEPTAMPRLGQSIALQVSDLPASGGPVLLATALSRTLWNGQALPVDLGGFGLPTCRAYTSADVVSLLLNGGGIATFQFGLPNNPAFFGLQFQHQALSLDAAVARPVAAAVSNGGEATMR